MSTRRATHRLRCERTAATVVVSLLCAVGACDGDEKTTSLVDPVYEDPCRYFPDDGCSNHGQCHGDERSQPVCACDVGYRGERCDSCEPGFHVDFRGLCISDRSCAEQPQNPCGSQGSCVDDRGVLSCDCTDGYGGPRCTLCADGYARDPGGSCSLRIGGTMPDASLPRDAQTPLDASVVDADAMLSALDAVVTLPDAAPTPQDATLSDADATALDAAPPAPDATPTPLDATPTPVDATLPDAEAGACSITTVTVPLDAPLPAAWPELPWPSSEGQCNPQIQLTLPPITMRSRTGAYVGLCARRSPPILGLNARHLSLVASPSTPAQLIAPRPIRELSFDYASAINALSLEVLADGVRVQVLEVAAQRSGRLTVALSKPATTIALKSLSLYGQEILIHHVEYKYEVCN